MVKAIWGPSVRSRSSRMPTRRVRHVGRTRLQFLLPREGQHALRQRSAATSPLHRPIDQPLVSRVVRQSLAKKLQIPGDRHQEVVEIMRHAAGELADHLHLLRLEKLLLRLFMRGDLRKQFRGAGLDPLLEGARQFGKRQAFGLELAEASAPAPIRRSCAR